LGAAAASAIPRSSSSVVIVVVSTRCLFICSKWLLRFDGPLNYRASANHGHRSLLRARRERPRRRAAQKRYELAPFHCAVSPVLPTNRIAHPSTAGDCCAAGFQPGLCRLWVRIGPGAMSVSMSGLPGSGHGWAIYEYTPLVIERDLTTRHILESSEGNHLIWGNSIVASYASGSF
jgi:hypothetical protein